MVEKILNNTTPYGKIRASHEGSLHSSTLTPLLSFAAVDFISGQLISLTNPIHRIPGQLENKPGERLFCDRTLSMC